MNRRGPAPGAAGPRLWRSSLKSITVGSRYLSARSATMSGPVGDQGIARARPAHRARCLIAPESALEVLRDAHFQALQLHPQHRRRRVETFNIGP